MSATAPLICIPVDLNNPGQFFACCGLFELAARLRPGATAAFDSKRFSINLTDVSASLSALVSQFQRSELRVGDDSPDQLDEDVGLASPMSLGPPFNLRLDWWVDKQLKPWAGTMNVSLIFKAMRAAINPESIDPLDDLRVVNDPIDPSQRNKRPNKREPFYFDSRRGGNAKSLDVGFAPDAFSMTSAACPAVEALCIIGLQRFRPMPTDRPRVFIYRAWTIPLPPSAAAAAACGLLPGVDGDLYRFENAFRTDQRKHKGFLPAIRINKGDIA